MSIALLLTMAVAAPPSNTVDNDPKRTVLQLLEGWRNADSEKAAATWAPDFRLLTLRQDGSGKRVEKDTRETLMKSMSQIKPGFWDIHPGSMIIRQDPTGIASVWYPYTFYSRGTKSHCGIESFTLYRLNEGWRIMEFADTHLWDGKETNCPDRPRRLATE